MADTLVITPTYNEKENIEKIIRKVFSLSKEFDMLIVEDNSPDGLSNHREYRFTCSLKQSFKNNLKINRKRHHTVYGKILNSEILYLLRIGILHIKIRFYKEKSDKEKHNRAGNGKEHTVHRYLVGFLLFLLSECF